MFVASRLEAFASEFSSLRRAGARPVRRASVSVRRKIRDFLNRQAS